MRHKLTVKQSKFVAAYIKGGNATKAALDAGYSKQTARSVGSENLTKPDIKAAIDKRMAEIESHKIAKADEILQYLTTVFRGEATETINVAAGRKVITIDDNPPTIKDRMAAGKELLKRYPDSDKLLAAQVKKAQADAEISTAKAHDANKDVETSESLIATYLDKLGETIDATIPDAKGTEQDGQPAPVVHSETDQGAANSQKP